LIDWLIDWYIDWLIYLLIDILIDWLIYWLIDIWIDWYIDWYIDWLIYWLIDGLVNWFDRFDITKKNHPSAMKLIFKLYIPVLDVNNKAWLGKYNRSSEKNAEALKIDNSIQLCLKKITLSVLYE